MPAKLLEKFNPNHDPGGPGGGQFISGDGDGDDEGDDAAGLEGEDGKQSKHPDYPLPDKEKQGAAVYDYINSDGKPDTIEVTWEDIAQKWEAESDDGLSYSTSDAKAMRKWLIKHKAEFNDWEKGMSGMQQRDVSGMQRAYSMLEIKSIGKDDERVIKGIASTPTVDRVGDIVRPRGAKFKVPMPLLWQHNGREPVGWVELAEPTDNGIPFTARFASIPEPGRLKDRIDEAWQSVKYGLVKAVSIGFKILKHEMIDKDDWASGLDIKEWEWLELSAVTIPANADCTITQIRSIVTQELAAASGNEQSDERRSPPAASGLRKPVKVKEKQTMARKSLADQISAYEATRQAKAARMQELADSSGEKGETMDESESQEFDGLKDEIKQIDDHLERLNTLEKLNVQKAAPINGTTPAAASESRAGSRAPVVTQMRDQLPPGIRFTRAIIASIVAYKEHVPPYEVAKNRWPENPEIESYLRHKAAVASGTTTNTTWAAPLVVAQNLPGEFAEFLRPATIIGRIPGLRNVPFNIKVPRQTTGASVNWVGETKVKPLSALAFDQVTLDFTKIAGIIPLSEELVRFSSPSAEAIVRDDLSRAVIQLMDRDFVDPTKALQATVSPASITNGVTPVTATGINAAAFRADILSLTQSFLDNNLGLAGAVWIMTSTQALAIGMMLNSLGVPLYPGITGEGGTLLGLPVVTSENIPDVGDSPNNGGRILLVKAPEILLADDGQVSIDVSREASLQMDSTPDSPPTASTVLVSLWQHNLIAVKAERYINWVKRRATAVAYINYAKYVGG